MSKYYVLKNGSEFKTIFMDQATADLWAKAGWEIAPQAYESRSVLASSRLDLVPQDVGANKRYSYV